MPYRYHTHQEQPHKWAKMESPDPTWNICIICGEIRDSAGKTMRLGAQDEEE